MSEQIEQQELIEAAAPRFLDYAVSVIKQRALPDVRDGLKPVHRRILYTMYHDMGMSHKAVTKKCAKIVGNALGSYHPHGDAALYEALIRLGQPFVNRVKLIDIQGNCGSLDDPKSFAAMRYVESRPSWASDLITDDLQYKCVKMVPTFDSATVEPVVLPAPFPFILCSSNIGIAVGFKTDVYPYNFNEMIEGTIAILTTDKEDKEIFGKIVKGPDFPTGGKITNGNKMFKYFSEGTSNAVVECTYEIAGNTIKITSIPFLNAKESVIESIADACKAQGQPKEKNYKPALINEISAVHDYSDKKGVNIHIKVKKDYKPEIVMNKLLKYTKLRVNTPLAFICLNENNSPEVMSFRRVVKKWFKFRKETVTNKYQFIADKLAKRIEILKACVSIIDELENVVKLIKKAEDKKDAVIKLSQKYKMSEMAATYIVEMSVYKFTRKEFSKMVEELEERIKLFKYYTNRLENPKLIKKDIIEELQRINEKYKFPRLTKIENSYKEDKNDDQRDLIEKEACTVYISNKGYVKRVSNDAIRNQKKGGKGRKIGVKEGDFINKIVPCNTHDMIMFVTTRGKMFYTDVFNIPELDVDKIGVHISSLVQLTDEDIVTSAFVIDNFKDKNKQLLIVTHNGLIKRTSLEEYSRFSRASGLIACKLKDDDYIVTCEVVNAGIKNAKVVVLSKLGYCVKFPLNEVPVVGRTTFGSRAIKSTETKEAKVIASFVIYNDNDKIFTVSSKGNGKCTDVSEYRETHRYKVGTKAMKLHEKEYLSGAAIIQDNEEAVVISDKKIIKFKTSDIRELKRATFGSRIIKLDKGEKVVGVCRLIELSE